MGLFKIFGIGSLIFILVVGGLAIYFYNFYTFAQLRICISNEVENSIVSCSANEQCRNYFFDNTDGLKENYEKAPDILKEKIDEVFEKAVYCQTTCKVRKISELDKASIIESCQEGEQEVVLNIKGKEITGHTLLAVQVLELVEYKGSSGN